jgi:hypothetical protein
VPREPCQKGTSVLPVVAALKAHPNREKLVPRHLWKYFDDHLVVSGWYPERDYFTLLEALVKTIDPKTSGGDVWRFFAKFSVQRDLAGADVKGVASSDAKGVYRSFARSTSDDPETFFRRATKLWSQYHDTGTMQICGGHVKSNSVVMRLVGFHIPLDGFVRLQGYYLEEFGHLIGIEFESHVTMSTARGDPCCEWEHTLARTPSSGAYVASLPVPE